MRFTSLAAVVSQTMSVCKVLGRHGEVVGVVVEYPQRQLAAQTTLLETEQQDVVHYRSGMWHALVGTK